MTAHPIGTREQCDSSIRQLLVPEKELTRLCDAVAEARRQLPRVAVDQAYTFDSRHGPQTLVELFEGREQLLVHHFVTPQMPNPPAVQSSRRVEPSATPFVMPSGSISP